MEQKKPKKLIGVVVSDKMQKTAVIEVSRLVRHSRYLKYLKRRTRLKAHNDENHYHVGDRVIVQETRPLSKEKRWIIVGKIDTSSNSEINARESRLDLDKEGK